MNDEIKEILEYISSRTIDDCLLNDYFTQLEDYITDLQEEKERLKDIINRLENYIQKGISKSKMFPTAEMAYQLILDKLKELEKGNE